MAIVTNSPPIRGLKTAHICHPTVLEFRNLKSTRLCSLWRFQGRIFPCLFHLLEVTCIPCLLGPPPFCFCYHISFSDLDPPVFLLVVPLWLYLAYPDKPRWPLHLRILNLITPTKSGLPSDTGIGKEWQFRGRHYLLYLIKGILCLLGKENSFYKDFIY